MPRHRAVREPVAGRNPDAPSTESRSQAGVLVLGGQRRLVLPNDVTHHLGVDVGDKLTYFLETDGSIRLKSTRAVIESYIGIFAEFGNGHEVDDFIAERRAEALREERGE